MNPIYSNYGQVIAWQNNKNIYHLNGRHAAVINGTNVYSHNGCHLGIFSNGLFRDQRGGAVAFLNGARGGPILPICAISPIPPIPSIPPIPAIPSLDWGISWEEFIN